MNQIRRYHECELRAEENDGKRTISGHAAVFYDGTPETEYDVFGWFTERVMPDAFDRAIKERDDARALFNHDPSNILGRVSAGTLTLGIDKRGLFYSVDVPDTTAGRDAWESVRRGDVQGNSMAFIVTDETNSIEDEITIREIHGVQLRDVGPVTYPAFESTDVQAYSLQDAERWMAEHKPATYVPNAQECHGRFHHNRRT